VREARRAREELGFVTAFLRATPLPGQTWFSVYWEALWGGAGRNWNDGRLSRMYQLGTLPPSGTLGTGNRLLRHVCTHVTDQMVTMVDIILSGVLERFPQLKVAFLECNCGWLPSWLGRMDRHWGQLGKNDAPLLTMKPSAYFMRQCVIGCEGDERDIGSVVQLIGDDNLVFSTDYPHSDSDFPKATQEFFHQEMPTDSRRKILWDNCVKFDGIER